MISRRTRNVIIWGAFAAICLALWWFAARSNLHFIRPLQFLGWVAVAAAAITALLCWDFIATAQERGPADQGKDL